MSLAGYRIDYDNLDVPDLMQQVRDRVAAADRDDPALPAMAVEAHSRVAEYFCMDDRQPYQLQQTLDLGTDWNLSPLDLRRSRPGTVGSLIRATRTLLRPLVKLFVNADLPLFKQFKLNLGMAAAVSDLLADNARQAARIESLSERIARLEESRSASGGDR